MNGYKDGIAGDPDTANAVNGLGAGVFEILRPIWSLYLN